MAENWIVSIILYMIVWVVYYSIYHDKIMSNKRYSCFLFSFFLILTLVTDLTNWIPTKLLCVVTWPFIVDFTLEKISTYNPYLSLIQEQIVQMESDLRENGNNPGILTRTMVSQLRQKRLLLRELLVSFRHIDHTN